MSKFHIEDDWYLVPDEYSWNLCRKLKTPQKFKEWAEITYHRTPEDALRHYLHLKQLEAVRKADSGSIGELVDILFAENKRLYELLRSAFAKVCDSELERGS